jgi:hypothetical protein
VEAKIMDIFTNATCIPHIGLALMRAAQDLGGADDVAIPQRTEVARAVDFRFNSSPKVPSAIAPPPSGKA